MNTPAALKRLKDNNKDYLYENLFYFLSTLKNNVVSPVQYLVSTYTVQQPRRRQ